jgi:hypothetical protein
LTKNISTLQRDLEYVLNTGSGYTRRSLSGSGMTLHSHLNDSLWESPNNERELYVSVTLELRVRGNFGIMSIAIMSLNLFLPAQETSLFLATLRSLMSSDWLKHRDIHLKDYKTQWTYSALEAIETALLMECSLTLSHAPHALLTSLSMENYVKTTLSGTSPNYRPTSTEVVDDPIVTEKNKAGFLAVDKQFGHIAVDIYDLTEDLERKEEEVLRKQHVVNEVAPPERTYEPVPHNKSGNMKLPVACSYCDYNRTCWPEARKFLYSNGPVFLTKVEREPTGNVFEDKDW